MTLPKAVDQTAILTGERTKIKDLLRSRLTECGWSDQVRMLCRDTVKKGDMKVDVDHIVQEVTPQARALVPDTVKRELLMKIKKILSEQEGLEL